MNEQCEHGYDAQNFLACKDPRNMAGVIYHIAMAIEILENDVPYHSHGEEPEERMAWMLKLALQENKARAQILHGLYGM